MNLQALATKLSSTDVQYTYLHVAWVDTVQVICAAAGKWRLHVDYLNTTHN